MKDLWYTEAPGGFDRYLLAGDVGGTNTNLGLVGARGSELVLLHELEVASAQVADFPDLVAQTAERYRREVPGLTLEACSIGANGPVADGFCHIHNLSWQIDGRAVEAATGLPTLIVNDFTSVSYALPFVDPADPQQALCLNPGAGPQGQVRAVVGAGTGMGVGILLAHGDRYTALASEGGHIDFAPFDTLTEQFRTFLERKTGGIPSVELACSGIGLRNLYLFAKGEGWFAHSQAVVAQIEAEGLEAAPRIIAGRAGQDPACRRIFETFVKIYARFAANIAATVLPRAGLFLAGGIASKNAAFFTERELFRRTFLQHGNPVIRGFLEQIPVSMILPYNTALIGAANAGINLR